MDGYKCAYRDLESPLTPIPPMDDDDDDKNSKTFFAFLTPKTSHHESIGFIKKQEINYRSEPLKSQKYLHKKEKQINRNGNDKRIIQQESPSFQIIIIKVNSTQCKPRKSLFHSPANKNVYYNDSNKNSDNNNNNNIKNYEISAPSVHCSLIPKKAKASVAAAFNQDQDLRAFSKSSSASSRKFKIVSPIPRRQLCPKMSALLEKIGLSKYKKLFKDEEIDYELFKYDLTEQDLVAIGIQDDYDRSVLLSAIYY